MTEESQEGAQRRDNVICWSDEEATESKWTRCKGPRTRYLTFISVTTPKNRKASKFGRFRAFMRIFPVFAFVAGCPSLMSFEDDLWEDLTLGETSLVKKMLLCDQEIDIQDLAIKQLIVAYIFYKEKNFEAALDCFKSLDILLCDYFVKRKIGLQGNAQIDQ